RLSLPLTGDCSMNQFWQMSIALLIVLGGVFYLGSKARTLFRQIKSGKGGSACGSNCGGCGKADQNKSTGTFVDLQLGENNENA
ncbi:MAG: FeoB-associated Cys-rich membrane protein, partial [Planctomycetaceae bacterium]|nr:FeoB-associated Cys-rich membrane protein [Planctomycetaceae bacterium]